MTWESAAPGFFSSQREGPQRPLEAQYEHFAVGLLDVSAWRPATRPIWFASPDLSPFAVEEQCAVADVLGRGPGSVVRAYKPFYPHLWNLCGTLLSVPPPTVPFLLSGF